MKEYALIYNPSAAAGKTKKLFEQACTILTELNVSFDLFKSEYAGHILTLARDLANDGYRLIGMGGDGTCNEVLNGAMNSTKKPLVGFIPIGSGNDIPGAIQIVPEIKRACEVIAEGYTEKCDIGISINSQQEKRYFLGIGSQGFDAEVTKRTNEGKKRLNGTWNYIASVLKTLFGFKCRALRITMDNQKIEGVFNCIAVGNGPSYGGWMFICPEAQVHDGILNISTVDMKNLPLLINFNKLYSKTLFPHPNIKTYTSRTVTIEMLNPADEPYLAQVDGEIIGPLPVRYEIIKDGYEFIKPRENEVDMWWAKKYPKQAALQAACTPDK